MAARSGLSRVGPRAIFGYSNLSTSARGRPQCRVTLLVEHDMLPPVVHSPPGAPILGYGASERAHALHRVAVRLDVVRCARRHQDAHREDATCQ